MTPFASVAMLEKLALLKMALWRAPVDRRASGCRTLFIRARASALSSAVTMDPWVPSTGGRTHGRGTEEQVRVQGPPRRSARSHDGLRGPRRARAGNRHRERRQHDRCAHRTPLNLPSLRPDLGQLTGVRDVFMPS